MSITKQGIITSTEFTEFISNTYDTNVYIEPDKSAWIRIARHNHPDTLRFSSSDSFTTQVYKSSDVWFNVALCNYLSGSWELMVKQALTAGGTETKFRWIQQTNPMAGSFNETVAANIQRNTSSGYATSNYGGIYKHNSNTYLVGNNGTNGNWHGAFGCWTLYNGGIPGFMNVVVTTGYMDLYLRMDSKSNLSQTSIDKNFIKTHSILEI